MKLKLGPLVLALLILFAGLTMVVYITFMDISTPSPAAVRLSRQSPAGFASDTVHIGVISRFSPNLIYEGYQPIMDYLSRETAMPFSPKTEQQLRRDHRPT